MIEFSGAFDPDTGACTVQVDNGRGDIVSEFTDMDPCYALKIALEEARWTPHIVIETQGRFL